MNNDEKKYWSEHRFIIDLLKQLPSYVFWKNIKGVYLGCNKAFAKAVGLKSSDEVKGKTDFNLPIQIAEVAMYQADDKKVITSGQPKINIEETQTFPNGEKKILLTSKVPLRNKSNQIIGILGIYNDISDLKKTQNALNEQIKKTEQAYHSKLEFIATASHEIRNPMGNVVYSINNLDEQIALLKSNFHEIVDVLNEAGKQEIVKNIQSLFKKIKTQSEQSKAETYRALNALINLGDLHRLQIEGVQPRYELSNIKELVQSALDNSTYPNNNKVDIPVTISASVPKEAIIDFSNIYDALCIIMGNAIRFSEEEGIIKISVNILEKNKQKFITIQVQDFGIGISSTQLEHMFAENEDKSTHKPSARYFKPSLQLPQARMKIEASNGTLEIKSTVKKGTTVIITVPYTDSKLTTSGASNEDEYYARYAYSILLVEDDIYAQRAIKTYLEGLKHKVDVASTSVEGIEMATSKDYDIVLMDITLPDKNGAETMREIQNKVKPSPLFIAVTSHASENDIDYFITQGFITVLTKPVNESALKNCINDVIAAKASDDNEDDMEK